MSSTTLRIYEKGERRLKHVGRRNEPYFQETSEGSGVYIGMCPTNIPDAEKSRLLNNALPYPDPDRDLPMPKKLYGVREGAIYAAQTSDHGRTYHAYPFRGKLGESLIEQLRQMADKEGCLPAFNRWLETYIERHGR